MLTDENIESIINTYVRDRQVLAFGTSGMSETFLKKVALRAVQQGWQVSVVPSSTHIAALLHELKLPSASVNDIEIDLAIEFVDKIDTGFNFIKSDSLSLVRDKMIAQSAAVLVAVAEEKNYVRKLEGKVAFEVSTFGWKHTLLQMQNLGKARIRKIGEGEEMFKTETGNYLIDVDIDPVYAIEDLDYQARLVPGVLETGIFLGYADRVVLHNEKMEVKSRMQV